MKEPCRCGAYDCHKCRSTVWPECRECGDALKYDENCYSPGHMEDKPEICWRCEGWIECSTCHLLHPPNETAEDNCGCKEDQ